MTKFVPTTTSHLHGGTRDVYKFGNGYGASVISHRFSYGGDAGLYELAVLDPNGDLTYETPITDDVIGWLTADHRIILARIDGGYPEWDLECTHAPDDQRFHFYCTECSHPYCLEELRHHDECIVRPWWGEEGIELVTDIDGPVTTPIPVRAVPHGEWWRLEAVPAEVDPTGAERYLAERLKDPEYRAAYTVAALTRAAELLTAAYLSEGK